MVSGFLDFWFLGVLVSSFLGFLVSKNHGFLVSKLHRINDSITPYYQLSISCFLMDIDLTSKTFKMLLNGSSGFVGGRLFQHFQIVGCLYF